MTKQLKISDLKRVVNIDEITRIANILKDEKSTENQILNAIEQLSYKTPSKEVLMQTKLGFILKDISKNEDLKQDIRIKAASVRKEWKEFHKNLLLAEKLDVKCDKPTTEKRQNAKTTLLKSINSINSTANSKINELEFLIFQYSDNLVNLKYSNIVRECANLIKQDADISKSFLNGYLSSKDLLSKVIDS
jgi:hypothetical protein